MESADPLIVYLVCIRGARDNIMDLLDVGESVGDQVG